MSQGHAYCGLVRAWDGSTAEKANRRQRHGRDGANEPEHGRDTGTIPTLLSTKDGRKALGSEGPGSWGLTPGTSQQTASLPAWLAEIQRGGVSAVTQVGPGAGDGDGHGSPPQQPQTGPAAAFPHRGALPAGRAPHDKREHVLPTDTGCRLGTAGAWEATHRCVVNEAPSQALLTCPLSGCTSRHHGYGAGSRGSGRRPAPAPRSRLTGFRMLEGLMVKSLLSCRNSDITPSGQQ